MQFEDALLKFQHTVAKAEAEFEKDTVEMLVPAFITVPRPVCTEQDLLHCLAQEGV